MSTYNTMAGRYVDKDRYRYIPSFNHYKSQFYHLELRTLMQKEVNATSGEKFYVLWIVRSKYKYFKHQL